MGKPKVAFYWCSSCGGCEEAVVDLDEVLLNVAGAVELVLWPAALDFRYQDIRDLPPGSITASFINGAIRTSEQEEIAELLRSRSQVVVAFGACAALGGIPALANLTSREEIFRTSYLESPTVVNPSARVPKTRTRMNGDVLTLPEFQRTVRRLSDVVEVDYTIPGCPPTPELVAEAVTALLEDRLPPPGSVLAPDQAICKSCSRRDTRPERMTLPEIRRVTEVKVDQDTCFLAQGVLCMGPATRDGCGEACIGGNMPCTGCFGPTGGVLDQGAKMIAMLGGILDGDDPEEAERSIAGLVDPAGTFYRYGLSASLVGRTRE